MSIIFESRHFLVIAPEAPLIDREDGGHIIIDPKIPVSTRQDLSAAQAIELMRLTLVTGSAMELVMNRHGVDIGRINYQDNSNWSVFKPEGAKLHYHLYGRAKTASVQKYGQTIHLPHREENPEFYQNIRGLNKKDVEAIREEIERLLSLSEFSDAHWRLDSFL